MNPNSTTIISDIKTAMEDRNQRSRAYREAPTGTSRYFALARDLRQAETSHIEIMQKAAHAFGALNGWRTRAHVRDFNIEDIGKRCSRIGFAMLSSEMMDHPIWYRANGKCAAIVAQPYDHAPDDHARQLAAKHGVAVHIPPHPQASFHFPGWTKFYVFTSLAHKIVWLPEQVTGIAAALSEVAS
jgi:hypothetical protein